jgi:hypothetical protein
MIAAIPTIRSTSTHYQIKGFATVEFLPQLELGDGTIEAINLNIKRVIVVGQIVYRESRQDITIDTQAGGAWKFVHDTKFSSSGKFMFTDAVIDFASCTIILKNF